MENLKEEILKKYGFTEKVMQDGSVKIYNKKKVLAAIINVNGTVEQKFTGRKNECGSIAAQDLKKVYSSN